MQKIQETIKQIEGLDYQLMQKAQERIDSLTKPLGSLGRLEELAKLIVGMTKKESPLFKNKVIFTLVADHGVAEEGVSAYPKEVTCQMVDNFLKGGAGINVLAKHIGARVVVVDMGVAAEINPPSPGRSSEKIGFGGSSAEALPLSKYRRAKADKNFRDKKINLGTKNMAKEPAMTKDEAIRAIEAGIEIFKEEMSGGIDIVGTGDMGIGNTTASSAITAVFTGKQVDEITGRGTGIDEQVLKNKIAVIKKAIEINRPNPKDPLDVLSKVGGFEIGGLVGIILASASQRVPIVIDGFISGAAALVASHLEPKVKDYLIASHCSVEKGHRVILNHLGLQPILDLNLRLGEGTGAALGMSIVEAAVKILTQMATFKAAGVSEKIKP